MKTFLLLFTLVVAPSEGGTTNCSVTFENQDSVRLTCHFNQDLRKLRTDFSTLRFRMDSSSTMPDVVLGCNWKGDNTTCYVASGYAFDYKISHDISLAIPNFTPKYEGEYMCQTVPPGKEDGINKCSLSEDDKPTPVPQTTTNQPVTMSTESSDTGGNSQQEENDTAITVLAVVVSCVLGVAILALVVYKFKRVRNWIHNCSGKCFKYRLAETNQDL